MVVIVEDPYIRTFLRSVLTRAGHRTVELDCREALNQVCSGALHVKALITNTPQAFRAVAGQFPLIYTTSCPDPEATQGFTETRTLNKPFQAGQLLEALNELSAHDIP